MGTSIFVLLKSLGDSIGRFMVPMRVRCWRSKLPINCRLSTETWRTQNREVCRHSVSPISALGHPWSRRNNAVITAGKSG